MRRVYRSAATSLLFVLTSGVALGDGPKGELVVEVTGFEHDRGSAMIALYDDPDAYPMKTERARKRVKAKISGKKTLVVLPDLPRTSYALSVFHDENDNGKLDTNFLGIPKEPVGSSNNAKGSFGPPKWKDAKFELDRERVTQKISMKKL